MSKRDYPLEIVVRFSTSVPDIVLGIENPASVSSISLKQRIRAQLQPPASNARLRLIHSGKVLADNAALSKSLNGTLPPPPRDGEKKTAKGKGKLPVRDIVPARVYIHCSIGDTLPPAELASETRAAENADTALSSKVVPSLSTSAEPGPDASTTTTPAPRGFDRLLSAGFNASEVAALRAQFLAIQAHTHTPDQMPTGQELLALEERWLDDGPNSAEGSGGLGDASVVGGEDAGGLEDMLYGNIIGFFWPIGAMCWLMREEGVWSQRKKIAVLSGFLINLIFGFVRVTG